MSTSQQTGEVTLALGGQPRTVAFTMGALLEFVGLQKGDFQSAIDSLSSGNPDAITPLVYCGLKARRKANSLPADFDVETAREWVAEIVFLHPDELVPLMNALSFAELGNRKGLTAPAPSAPAQA
jgi:hypothetical protein